LPTRPNYQLGARRQNSLLAPTREPTWTVRVPTRNPAGALSAEPHSAHGSRDNGGRLERCRVGAAPVRGAADRQSHLRTPIVSDETPI
jgi:hypothetical protein